ncbi:MAG: aminoglycoside resistance protein [Nocardioidaceae bacterium]|nr:aminoglycoside resistance protein [Nocardioidaceae bacterium]
MPVLTSLYDEWELRPEGSPVVTETATVVPVRTARGDRAVLKVSVPTEANEHEHLALSHWAGRGAATLLRADPRRRALLLGRLTGEDLGEAWDVEACEIVGRLYSRLHVPAFRPLRLLSEESAAIAVRLAGLPRNAPLPRRMVEQAVSLARSFAVDPATDGVVVHTDLHYRNVLLDEQGQWRAISPKPLSGDPHHEPAPMLLQRYDELAGDVRNGLRRRFHALVDTAGLDEDRARDWAIVRAISQAAAHLDDRDLVTRAVAVAKAVQD